MKSLFVTAALTILLTISTSAASTTFPFKDGDRVVFLGDSITEQRFYTNYLETYLLTRFPTWNLQFRNAGWSGDTANLRTRGLQLPQALQRDVLDLKPSVVTINYGMNDFGYGAFDQNLLDAHIAGETFIVRQLKAAAVRPLVLTPSPVEKNEPGNNFLGLNENLSRYAAADAAIAVRENVPFADQFTPYIEAVNRLRAIDPTLRITPGDEVHPKQPGGLMMASFILTALNAPSTVSAVTLNAETASVTQTEGATISNAIRTKDGLTFRRLDQALVFPIEPAARPALQVVPVADLISRYMLAITNLEPGTYSIAVNGKLVTKASADELSHGLNLGSYQSPLSAAGQKILDQVNKKNLIYFRLWRDVKLSGGSTFDIKRQSSELETQLAARERAIDALRKPAVFKFEIRKLVLGGESPTEKS